jgi:hypothetical protein
MLMPVKELVTRGVVPSSSRRCGSLKSIFVGTLKYIMGTTDTRINNSSFSATECNLPSKCRHALISVPNYSQIPPISL